MIFILDKVYFKFSEANAEFSIRLPLADQTSHSSIGLFKLFHSMSILIIAETLNVINLN